MINWFRNLFKKKEKRELEQEVSVLKPGDTPFGIRIPEPPESIMNVTTAPPPPPIPSKTTASRIAENSGGRSTSSYAGNYSTGPYYDQRDENGDFLLSMAVANATDSTVLGAIVGGDVSGAILGDMMNDSDNDSDNNNDINSDDNSFDNNDTDDSWDSDSSSDSDSSWSSDN